MANRQWITVLTTVVLLLLVAGCVEILPQGWNASNASPTTAIVAEMQKTTTVLTEENETATPEEIIPEASATPETTPADVPEMSVAPAVEDKGLPRKAVTEGELVSFPNLQATDPDGDPITYTFTPPLDTQGTWQTKVGDAGEYKVTITASDGKNSVSQTVVIQVNPKNRAPVIELAGKEVMVKEGESVTLSPTVTDPDGDKITVTFEGWMTSQSRATTFTDAGRHEVEIIASDGTATSREMVTVVVENVNRAPTLQPITDVIVKENDKITLNPTATDADGDKVTFLYSTPIAPDGMWQPAKKDVGKYRITVTATDGMLNASTSFLLVVESLNQAPVIQMADLVTVDEGQTVTLSPVITDPEGDKLTITYSGWMNADTHATTYEDAGSHLVTITVNDGTNTAKKDVTVMVNDVNRAPTFGQGAFS